MNQENYHGIGQLNVTVAADEGLEEGMVCKLTADGAAGCGAGEAFCGVADVIRDGLAGVQIEGFVTLGYTGTAPVVGYANLSANGSGGVKGDTAGKSYLVAAVDATDSIVTFKL